MQKEPPVMQVAEKDSLYTFSKWRRRLWPFHRSELPKLFPLILIKFLVSISYGILTCMKDTMVVTAKGSGAEVIPVLKGWIVLPAAMLVAILYSKLSNVLSKRKLFYTVLSAFLVIIFIYGFILYPNVDALSPHESSDWLLSKFGTKYQHWIAVYRNWIQSLFFITAELWGSVVILVMFWGFANDVTSVDEAKRSYNIYIAAGDFGLLCIGPIICYFTKKLAAYPFVYTVQTLISVVLFAGLAILAIYWWTNKKILNDSHFFNVAEYKEAPKKTKEKLSLRQGFKHLIKSRYLLGIAILVVGYGLTVNLIEVTWKASLKLTYSNPADYQVFTSKTSSFVGLFAFLISLFLGSNIIRRLGWRSSAQITPILVGVTGAIFFLLVLYKDSITPLAQTFGLSSLGLIVLFGAFQNIASKVAKYSFFDPTKEMSYIPLDEEAKVKGKAAIDIVGSRLGKSGSSWIQVALIDLFGTGSIFSVTHILLPIIIVVTITWMMSVHSLSKKFDEKHKLQKLSLKRS